MAKLFRIVLLCALFISASALAQAAAFQEGDNGQEVLEIQARLAQLGYNVVPDGDFGENTAEAVKQFQRDRGLDSDGVIGAQTYGVLMGREMPVSRGSTSIARRIISTALQYEGVPYVFGGTSPYGFDCSGFTRFVFGQYGIYLPRMADEQYEVGRAVSYSRLQPGDLLYFSTYTAGVSHVGIYLGNGQFISATSSRGIAIDSLGSGYWGNCYVGARRVL